MSVVGSASIAASDGSSVRIALHTLGMFNFRGIQLLPFLRDCVVSLRATQLL